MTDIATLSPREHEVFVKITREWPEWQECQHGKRCVEVLAHWSDDAPFTVTTGKVNSTQRYPRTVHADGSESASFEYGLHVKCPECGKLDTLKVSQEAYGDRTTCETPGCEYTNWYSIGD